MQRRSIRALIGLSLLGCVPAPLPLSHSSEPADESPVAVDRIQSAPEVCAGRSLDDAVGQGRAALATDETDSSARLGLAIEQALACEARARRWQLELDAVALLAELDPLPEPVPQRCRMNSEGICIYRSDEKKQRRDERRDDLTVAPYDELDRARLAAYAQFEAEAAPGEPLRAIRERHIRLRLAHADHASATPLLQDYLLDYEDHPSAVALAAILVDTMINLWRVEPRPKLAATSLLGWLDRFETLALWRAPDADALRIVIADVRPAVMWQAGMETIDSAAAIRDASPLVPDRRDELAEFQRCASIFLELYTDYPGHDRRDTVLWNVAHCADAAGDFDLSVTARSTLLREYPDSEHYRYTLHNLAEQHHAVANYAEAAEYYAEFARRYPKDSDSPNALRLAYQFQRALGQDTSAVVEQYVVRQRKYDIKSTGTFVWAARPEGQQALLEYSDEFLRDYGNKAGVASLEARRTLAELVWDKACPGQIVDGLCVARKPPATNGCTLGDVPLPRVLARTGKHAEQARARFRTELKYTRTQRNQDWVEEDRIRFATVDAASAFNVVEIDLEEFLLAGPDAPDARERARELDARYLEVAALLQLDFAIRAHARRGLVWEVLATADHRAHEGACLPTTAWASGDRRRAVSAYTACLDLAVERHHFNAAARRCEAWLGAAEPEIVPPLVELVGDPWRATSELVGTGVVGKLPKPCEPPALGLGLGANDDSCRDERR